MLLQLSLYITELFEVRPYLRLDWRESISRPSRLRGVLERYSYLVLLVCWLCTPASLGAQTYKIVNWWSGKVLDVTGGASDLAMQNGTPVTQYQWLGGLNQQWELIPLGNGYSEIVNRQSQKVLDVIGGDLNNGTGIQQWEWIGGLNQQWQIVPIPNG
jgi:Ricin-type beta-trefoil lectin domain-like